MILRHLENDYTEPVRDPVWKNIYLSKSFIRIIECESFQNLNMIKQLGPAYLVYPGATHTRFSHSLGVFHIAKLMITNLAKQNKSTLISFPFVKAFLCAALLHDLGHFPYAHSLKDLNLETHEKLTGKKILNEKYYNIIKKDLEIDPHIVASIIDRKLDCAYNNDITFYRNLLSGVLDPDKLDYLNRDAYFCGIPYGRQDVDHIISNILPHPVKGLAVKENALTSIESILFAKYIMYKTVYWHKTVRVATSMIKKAIYLGLLEGVISPAQLYGLNDRTLFFIANSCNFPPFKLFFDVNHRYLFKQVFSIKFDPNNKMHLKLEKLSERLKVEKFILNRINEITGSKINYDQIIIDIPEAISFEIDVPVLKTGKKEDIPYKTAGSVFTEDTVNIFTQTLRFVSISLKREDNILKAMEKIDFNNIIKEYAFV